MYMTTTLPRTAARDLGRAWLARCLMRARTRAQLARLDAARLDDLGLTRDAARAEAARPFWA